MLFSKSSKLLYLAVIFTLALLVVREQQTMLLSTLMTKESAYPLIRKVMREQKWLSGADECEAEGGECHQLNVEKLKKRYLDG